MASGTRTFTPGTARQVDRFSVANGVTVKQAPPCGGEPYVDVFTYRRWKAQGFQVQRGEKTVKLPLMYQRSEKDRDTGEERTVRRMGRSAVFCRCQVKPIRGKRYLGNCSVCGGKVRSHTGDRPG